MEKKILALEEKRQELLSRAEAIVTKGLNDTNRETYRQLIQQSDECFADASALRRIARAMPNLPTRKPKSNIGKDQNCSEEYLIR